MFKNLKARLAILAVVALGAMGAGVVAAPVASAAASCTLSSTPFVPSVASGMSNYVAAQMTMSGCTDTKAVKFTSISSIQVNACLGQPAGDCPQVHYEELIAYGSAPCHMTAGFFYQRQDWTCGNATGTISGASLYEYVYRPDVGFALTPGNCTYALAIVGYKLQSYSTGSWSNDFWIAGPYQYICAP